MCVCVCVCECVCMCMREKEREGGRERKSESFLTYVNFMTKLYAPVKKCSDETCDLLLHYVRRCMVLFD